MDGITVKKIRRVLDLTQEEFAHRLGVTICTVSRWENDKTTPSRLAKMRLQEIAKKVR